MTKKEKQKELISAVNGLESMVVFRLKLYDDLMGRFNDYLRGSLDALDLDGLMLKVLRDLRVVIQEMSEELCRLERMVLTVFNALISNGVSEGKAFKYVGASLDAVVRKRNILTSIGIEKDEIDGIGSLLKCREKFCGK
jgi:hypothetical protein